MGGLTDGGHILQTDCNLDKKQRSVSLRFYEKNDVAVKLPAKVRKVQISGLLQD